MRRLIFITAIIISAASAALAGDLYKVTIHSHKDADILRSETSEIIMKVPGGYLVLVDSRVSESFLQAGLDTRLLATGVERDQIFVDARFDRKNAEQFEVLYEDGPQRLLLVNVDRLPMAQRPLDAYPLTGNNIEIIYDQPVVRPLPEIQAAIQADVALLAAEIEQANLQLYAEILQSHMVRLVGTDENYASRDWIVSKFDAFGYDQIAIDPFTGIQSGTGELVPAYNVIVRKTGTVFPDQHIVIGGHFDAVPLSPGADDNASGTAAVLEIARVLQDVETAMSFVFIAFDNEELGLQGSRHYVYEAVRRNEDIVLMINLDMIAHKTNTDRANVYYGVNTDYAALWRDQAVPFGIVTTDFLTGGASDQQAFWEAGYDAIFVQEDEFSTHWHKVTDSTVHMDFVYMTRMVKASLATALTIDQHPPPIRIVSLVDPGDGQSQIVNWHPVDQSAIAYYRLSWYPTSAPAGVLFVDVPPTQTSHTVDGLSEGEQYGFYVEAYDFDGYTSFSVDPSYATPSSVPDAPAGVSAMPVPHAIEVSWTTVNTELDFDHCEIVRDGIVIGQTATTEYIDDDPALGSDLHYYYVVATDTDGIQSDTTGIEPVWSKAATLQSDRILAVNRTSIHEVDFVDEVETGVFLREALDGYDFEYYSDTFATTCPSICERVSLLDLVDYGLVVIGAEAARYDDIAINPLAGGMLDTLAYYLSIGGKAVVFGRWGDEKGWDTLDYSANVYGYDDAYHDYFHIEKRVKTTTTWPQLSTELLCDMIGAHPANSNYPELVWDSAATLAHANDGEPPITDVGGVPCVSFVELASGLAEVIYNYNSRHDDPLSEGKPVAWRYLGSDYRYVYFDIPLSMFERASAGAALCRAIEELLGHTTDISDGSDERLPVSFSLSQNYPNPFNPYTRIEYSLPVAAHVEIAIYNILGQKITTVVDEDKPAGTYTVDWPGVDAAGKKVASGIYLYQMKADGITESRKMLLLK